MRVSLRSAAWIASALAVSINGVRAETEITLSPADVDRAGQVITFPLPAGIQPPLVVRDSSGHSMALQVDAKRVARFVLPWQAAGTSPSFALVRGRPSRMSGMGVKREAGDLSLVMGGKPVLTYRMDKEKLPRTDIKPEFKRAGYLHPIVSPAGHVVTDDFPAQHIHHHGIWSPWTKTRFQGRSPDFWNMGAKTGTVEFVALDRSSSGPVLAEFSARHRMVDLSAPSPVAALNETWLVTLYDLAASKAPARMFDLEITQTCATSDPLILPEYHYGGLGYRGREEWLGPENARYLTSEGETDRVKAHAKRARWINQYGAVEGGLAGLTILGHPGNFRAPQPLRVHPKEPFVCFAPSQMGEWKIEPGQPYVARYRFVVMDGAPDRALLEAYWQGYAQPAAVQFSR